MKKSAVWLLSLCLIAPAVALVAGQASSENFVKAALEEYLPDLIKIRRQIHQNPERGNREFKTAALVAGRLKSLGFEVKEGVAHTGVVALLHGRKPGRVVAVRADMDALPIQEKTDLPFKSQVDGVMHACGHDIHTTVGLGTAMVLAKLKDRFDGTVKFIFQPAEEGSPPGELGGASLMVREGVLENPAPEVIFGLHVGSGLPVGMLAYTPEGALASNDMFEIIIKGKGVHASSPWGGVDPIITAAQVVTALQNIRSRMTDTRIPFVVSVSMIHGGTAFNIIPEEVKMTGTIRAHDQEVRKTVKTMMRQVIDGVCKSMGATFELNIHEGTPVTYNEPGLTRWAVDILGGLLGESRVFEVPPTMGSEDFASYSQRIPAFFYFLGVSNNKKEYQFPVHNPYFCADEGSIPVGIESMTRLVLSFLGSDKTFALR